MNRQGTGAAGGLFDQDNLGAAGKNGFKPKGLKPKERAGFKLKRLKPKQARPDFFKSLPAVLKKLFGVQTGARQGKGQNLFKAELSAEVLIFLKLL